MAELFPYLKGLKGGKKQLWLNSNLDTIAMLAEHMSIDDLCKVLYCKPETVVKALKKAETRHRPTITRLDKAELRIAGVDNKINTAMQELEVQAEALMDNIGKTDQLQKNLRKYFEIQSQLSDFMSKLLVQSGRGLDVNFTQHIASTNKRKVALTRYSGRVRLPFIKKVGLTSRASDIRLSHFNERRSRELLRSRLKGIMQHRRHSEKRRHDAK